MGQAASLPQADPSCGSRSGASQLNDSSLSPLGPHFPYLLSGWVRASSLDFLGGHVHVSSMWLNKPLLTFLETNRAAKWPPKELGSPPPTTDARPFFLPPLRPYA